MHRRQQDSITGIYYHDCDPRGGDIYYSADVKSTAVINWSSLVEHCTIRLGGLLHLNSVVVCCMYRLPSSRARWIEDFRLLQDSLTTLQLLPIITGDFNKNLLANDSFDADLKAEFHLTQIITKPTRETKSSATLIDHIYASNLSLIAESGVIYQHLFDHYTVFCCLNVG